MRWQVIGHRREDGGTDWPHVFGVDDAGEADAAFLAAEMRSLRDLGGRPIYRKVEVLPEEEIAVEMAPDATSEVRPGAFEARSGDLGIAGWPPPAAISVPDDLGNGLPLRRFQVDGKSAQYRQEWGSVTLLLHNARETR